METMTDNQPIQKIGCIVATEVLDQWCMESAASMRHVQAYIAVYIPSVLKRGKFIAQRRNGQAYFTTAINTGKMGYLFNNVGKSFKIMEEN